MTEPTPDTPESELTLREALEWALDNLEAEDEFLGSPVEGEQTTYTVTHAGRTVTMARSTQYAEGIRKARAALDTPESELTGDGLRAAAERLSDFLFDGIGWIEHGPSGMSIADAEFLMGLGDELRAALAALPNREAAPREGLERAKRLQSAHHRMLRVTAVTCDACRKERLGR